MAQNEIRGSTQIKAGSIPVSKVDASFFSSIHKEHLFTASGSTAVFDFSSYETGTVEPNSVKVYVRGLRWPNVAYTVDYTAKTITLSATPEADDMVLVEWRALPA